MHEIYQYIIDQIDQELIPALCQFIRIPNQSRAYDPQWDSNGLQDQVCFYSMVWGASQGLVNANFHFVKEPTRTPCVLVTVDCPNVTDAQTILLYGHLDKQPPLTDRWSPGLHPYDPVMRDGRLYGRGSTDDGYAFFACITLIKALQKFQFQKHRFVMMFETDEESGSKDLLYFLQQNAKLVGSPNLVICLDSGALLYDRLFTTNSLRGYIEFKIKLAVTSTAVHSGSSSGIIPDSFRILRTILESLENSDDQEILIDSLYTNIPEKDYSDAFELVQKLGKQINWDFPFIDGVQPVTQDIFQQYINVNWRPAMVLTGIDGVPDLEQAGNVVRPFTTLLISMRLPPNLDSADAEKAITEHFKSLTVPYNAVMEVEVLSRGNGFVSGELPDDLKTNLNKASIKFLGNEMMGLCVGGSIPFMNDLSKFYPEAKFLVTGVDGPGSNMHAPDECLNVDYLKQFLKCLAYALDGQVE